MLAQEIQTLEITLHPDGVATPVQRAALIALDVVAASLTALAEGELSKPSMPKQFFNFRINGPDIDSNERRLMYENWLLAKGFQDLVRGVRESLEEAFLYVTMLKMPTQRTTMESVQTMIDGFRRRAAGFQFPALLAEVNAKLKEPISFEREFLSLQKTRNCLEHRSGIVGRKDIDDGGTLLTLSFPRLKPYYERDGEEIELTQNAYVEAGTVIMMRYIARSRSYELGQHINISTIDFSEISMACHLFGSELANKLPTI